MAKKISIVVILLTVGFFCLGSNMLLAKDYTSVEDIQLDGEDAIGKRATLCIQSGNIDNDSYGKRFWANDVSKGLPSKMIYIYFDKNQKELFKKIQPTPHPSSCTIVTIEVFELGMSIPRGRLISVGKQMQFR